MKKLLALLALCPALASAQLFVPFPRELDYLIIDNIYTAHTNAVLGTDGDGKLTSTNVTASASGLDPSTTMRLYDDFLSHGNTGGMGWTVDASGGVVAGSAAIDGNHPGLLDFAFGSSATDRACIYQRMTGMNIGGGQIDIYFVMKFDSLPASGNDYRVIAGLGKTTSSATQTDGIYFEASFLLNEWYGVCTASSASSDVSNSVALSSTGFNVLHLTINAAGTAVDFEVNGTSLGQVTGNIPTTTTDMGLMFGCYKVDGTTTKYVKLDMIYMTQTFTSARW